MRKAVFLIVNKNLFKFVCRVEKNDYLCGEKFEEVLLLMSIHNIFGIPFRIVSCSGEAASQFYNPLQESPLSDLCATMDGGDPTNVAQIIFKNE